MFAAIKQIRRRERLDAPLQDCAAPLLPRQNSVDERLARALHCASMSSPRAPARPWLHGPIADLLFGCGAGYALVVAALAWFGVAMDAMRGWLPFVVLL